MELKQLCEIHAPSGDEGQLRKLLLEEGKRLCGAENARIDRSGNVVCTRKGTQPGKPHVCVSAHMDEVGFIIEAATEDGLLRFHPIGGIDPRVVVSKRVLVGHDLLPGVIGAMAIHLQSAADRNRVLGFDGLYIDIGAKDKAEALAKCPVGTYAYFDTPYQPFGDGFVCAKALDDRVGCYTILELMRETYPCDVTFVFAVQEEVGCRGSKPAAYAIAPDYAIAVDVTNTGDMIGAPPMTVTLGGGAAIKIKDASVLCSKVIVDGLTALAEAYKIPYQYEILVAGGTDTSSMQTAGAGAHAGAVSIPTRYVHSPVEVVDAKDLDACVKLLRAAVERGIDAEK